MRKQITITLEEQMLKDIRKRKKNLGVCVSRTIDFAIRDYLRKKNGVL